MQQSPCNPDAADLRGCLRSVPLNRAATVRERFPNPNRTATPCPLRRVAMSRVTGRFSHANRTASSRARLGKSFLLHALSPIDGFLKLSGAGGCYADPHEMAC